MHLLFTHEALQLIRREPSSLPLLWSLLWLPPPRLSVTGRSADTTDDSPLCHYFHGNKTPFLLKAVLEAFPANKVEPAILVELKLLIH